MKNLIALSLLFSVTQAFAVAYTETLCEINNFSVRGEKVELVMRSDYATNYAEEYPIEFFFRTVGSRDEVETLGKMDFSPNECAKKNRCRGPIASISGTALKGDFFNKGSLIQITTLANDKGKLKRVEITGENILIALKGECGDPALYP